MSFEYPAHPQTGPQWKGVLPGRPAPYVLRRGEGEHALLFRDAFTVLLSADETGGQFGIITADTRAGDVIPAHTHDATHETFYVIEGRIRLFYDDPAGGKTDAVLTPGDFAYVPAGVAHAYQSVEDSRMTGTLSGGFERFFQELGTPVDDLDGDRPPFVPDLPRMQTAARNHGMRFLPDLTWPTAGEEA